MTREKNIGKCEYETNEGHCTLNECMYGDFLFVDDSRYCFCNEVTEKMKQKIKEVEELKGA